ncbi:hypothetical protein M0802_002600 [Mischocyttarus mexicanus]|nr:hypothetical protein M0802_002600 [Mischocyttarus mexicanus]
MPGYNMHFGDKCQAKYAHLCGYNANRLKVNSCIVTLPPKDENENEIDVAITNVLQVSSHMHPTPLPAAPSREQHPWLHILSFRIIKW